MDGSSTDLRFDETLSRREYRPGFDASRDRYSKRESNHARDPIP